MRKVFCDTPDCGRDITSESRFIVEVNVLDPNESAPKMKPALPGREICAACKEELRVALDELGLPTGR